MKVLGIIPARYGSTRFPGKPLALIHGKTMIERVYNRVIQSKLLTEVIVATDDSRIFEHIKSFGGRVTMTDSAHPSGTDRCAEVLEKSEKDFDIVVNIQGDEPYIHPDQIDQLINCFKSPDTQIATLVKVIHDATELHNPNIPKVILQKSGQALYFSRRPVPYCAEAEQNNLLKEGHFLKHIGIYGYRAAILPHLAKLKRSQLEIMESLEQLRWLENGYTIMTGLTAYDNVAVDSPEDILIVEKKFS